ncbi:hypothetical protein FNF28_05805 [Cafeteria roenbergensis]|uniref:Uncharacterized protein n=2 Tax=Cafeteria roenbergensis TaxID=33653 RepID=A0A5A8D6L9_CAFRO|nr:hypothetical protein FNF28_05805 [Cafeteria roenbergensis]
MHGENDCGGYAKACHAAHAKVRGGRRVSCTTLSPRNLYARSHSSNSSNLMEAATSSGDNPDTEPVQEAPKAGLVLTACAGKGGRESPAAGGGACAPPSPVTTRSDVQRNASSPVPALPDAARVRDCNLASDAASNATPDSATPQPRAAPSGADASGGSAGRGGSGRTVSTEELEMRRRIAVAGLDSVAPFDDDDDDDGDSPDEDGPPGVDASPSPAASAATDRRRDASAAATRALQSSSAAPAGKRMCGPGAVVA